MHCPQGQVVTGLLEFHRKNVFASNAFLCYGFFWLATALNGTLQGAGIWAPTTKGTQMAYALWGCITVLFWLQTFVINFAVCFLFGGLAILFFLLAASQTNPAIVKVRHGRAALPSSACRGAQRMEWESAACEVESNMHGLAGERACVPACAATDPEQNCVQCARQPRAYWSYGGCTAQHMQHAEHMLRRSILPPPPLPPKQGTGAWGVVVCITSFYIGTAILFIEIYSKVRMFNF